MLKQRGACQLASRGDWDRGLKSWLQGALKTISNTEKGLLMARLPSVTIWALRMHLALFKLPSSSWLFWCQSLLVTKTSEDFPVSLTHFSFPDLAFVFLFCFQSTIQIPYEGRDSVCVCVCVCVHACMHGFGCSVMSDSLWPHELTVAHQTPLSVEFSKHKWPTEGLSFLSFLSTHRS